MAYEYLTLDEVLEHVNMSEEEMEEDTEAFDKKLDNKYLTLCLGCDHYVDKDEYHPDEAHCERCKPFTNQEVYDAVSQKWNVDYPDGSTNMFELQTKAEAIGYTFVAEDRWTYQESNE